MHRGSATLLVLLLTGLFIASLAHAQDGRSVVLRANGQLILKDADGEFGTLELNLHNSNWKYASQADATAQCEDQAAGGKAFTGALAVPDVAGAGISFLETISQGDDGLHVIYELKPSGPMIPTACRSLSSCPPSASLARSWWSGAPRPPTERSRSRARLTPTSGSSARSRGMSYRSGLTRRRPSR